MSAKWTTPAPKYGQTATYGDCEATQCSSGARTTCTTCGAHVCFGHAQHRVHAPSDSGDSTD